MSRLPCSLVLAVIFTLEITGSARGDVGAIRIDSLTNKEASLTRKFLGSGPIQAEIVTRKSVTAEMAVVLRNRTKDFYCFLADDLNTQFSGIMLFNSAGARVPTKWIGERLDGGLLGFNYDGKYFFLLPGETKSVTVDHRNFEIKSGKYQYELNLDYYRCGDVIDRNRIAAREAISFFGIRKRGHLSWPPSAR